jgi:hypothetical protein
MEESMGFDLGRLFGLKQSTDLSAAEVELEQSIVAARNHLDELKASMRSAPFESTPEELKALRAYVDAGGVLLVDACGGSPAFAESANAAITAAFPERAPQVMPREHLLFDPGAPGMDDLRKPRLRRYSLEHSVSGDTRPRILRSGPRGGAVILSDLDLTAGLLGTETWGSSGYEPSYAESLVKNLIFWTLDGKPE